MSKKEVAVQSSKLNKKSIIEQVILKNPGTDIKSSKKIVDDVMVILASADDKEVFSILKRIRAKM